MSANEQTDVPVSVTTASQPVGTLEELCADLEVDTQLMAMAAYRVSEGATYEQIATKFNIAKHDVHKRMINDKGVEVVKWLMERKLVLEAATAARTLTNLMHNAKSEKVRLDAAIAVLDKAGFNAAATSPSSLSVTGNNVQVNISL